MAKLAMVKERPEVIADPIEADPKERLRWSRDPVKLSQRRGRGGGMTRSFYDRGDCR